MKLEISASKSRSDQFNRIEWPYGGSADSVIDPLALFCNTAVITVLGCVHDWTLHWAGRISCTLRTSTGAISVSANRDTLPLEIKDGSWLRARLELNQESFGPATTLLRASVLCPAEVLAIKCTVEENDSKTTGAAS